jgi:hypothetical protein
VNWKGRVLWRPGSNPVCWLCPELGGIRSGCCALRLQSAAKKRAEIIRSAPEKDRVEAIATAAEFFRVDVSKLLLEVQAKIVLDQINLRSRREFMTAIVVLVFAVLLAIVVIVAITVRPDRGPPLSESHFDIVDGFVPGGWMLGITNASTENAKIYGGGFEFPAQSVETFRGVKIDHATMKSFAVTVHLGNDPGENPVFIPGKTMLRVPAFAYGCDPQGRQQWRFLNDVYKASKNGPVGNCTIRMKISSTTEEASLSKDIDCAKLVVVTSLPCPN